MLHRLDVGITQRRIPKEEIVLQKRILHFKPVRVHKKKVYLTVEFITNVFVTHWGQLKPTPTRKLHPYVACQIVLIRSSKGTDLDMEIASHSSVYVSHK